MMSGLITLGDVSPILSEHHPSPRCPHWKRHLSERERRPGQGDGESEALSKEGVNLITAAGREAGAHTAAVSCASQRVAANLFYIHKLSSAHPPTPLFLKTSCRSHPPHGPQNTAASLLPTPPPRLPLIGRCQN